jgi:hypothetical protein
VKALAFAFALVVSTVLAQAPPAAPALPELEAIRAPYQRNVQALLAARQQRVATLTQNYLLALDRLQQEVAARGDLDAGLQIKAERERAKAAQELAATERRAMPPALQAVRAKFDKDFEAQMGPLRKAEEQQARDYLSALEALQRKLTVANRLEQAATVRAERESASTALQSLLAAAAPSAKATPPPAVTNAQAARAGALDPAFASKVASAVHEKSYDLTESSEDTERLGGRDLPDMPGVLVGFEFFEQKSHGFPDIRSLRPIFLTKDGLVPGKERGRMEKITNKVLAKPGYAVAGLLVHHNPGRIQGIQVTFMKMDPGTLRLDTSPASTYRSLWFGTRPRGDKPKELGGDGRPVIGVFGKSGADCDTIGLIQVTN